MIFKKIVLVVILFFGLIGYTQTKGNKKIVTKTYSIDNIETIKINLYAKISIDCDLKNQIIIKTDENLIKFIDRKVENGVLDLNQLKWIQGSQRIEISIGAPNLKMIETGTHDTVIVENFKNDTLKITSPIGKIKVRGTTNYLSIDAKNGTIDVSNLIAKNAKITITGDSKTKVNVTNELKVELSERARFQVLNTPQSIRGNYKKPDNTSKTKNNITWINIKLKNNSIGWHKLVVVGPKQDGSQFSYGFSMLPGSTKKERWSVGSKIYKSNSLGTKKLLATITKENKDEVVKLFKN